MGIDQIVSDFDHMQYHPETRFELNQYIQADKIPNALLFTGPFHSGKREAAFWFAKGCNCITPDHIGCSKCKPCLKIEAGTHPDILEVKPETGKKAILISQIRQLAGLIATRPNEAAYRMVLITQSDLMNVQAQNALLKMLEEPPEKTFFILLENSAGLLLPTIVSRCRRFRFSSMTFQQAEQILCTDYKTDPLQTKIAVRTADRDLNKALAYLNLAPEEITIDWIKKRKWLINSIFDLLGQEPDTPDANQIALMLSWRLNNDGSELDDSIAIMKTVLRDFLVFFYAPQQIVNLDFSDKFKDIGLRLSAKLAVEWLSILFETERKLTQNCSARLVLDSFFLQIAQSLKNAKA